MWYLYVGLTIAALTIIDGITRRIARWSIVGWAAAAFVAFPISAPIYLAVRPLKVGERREGGTGWHVVRNFALVWTGLMVVAAVFAIQNLGSAGNRGELSSTWVGAGALIALSLIACTWLFVAVCALVLGTFIKNNQLVEIGPTGPLAVIAPAPARSDADAAPPSS
jgi:hypothetical protein